MNLHVLLFVFGVIFVAELPDKTALAALVLATRHRPFPVFVGAALALAVQSLVAIVAGRLLAFLPARIVHVGAGVVFLIAAAVMWFRHEEAESSANDDAKPSAGFFRTASAVFAVVFIAEWGDLTQFGTAVLAAQFRAPFTVFVGATLALWAVTAIAILVGNRAARFLDAERTKRVAAIVFAIVGVLLIVRRA